MPQAQATSERETPLRRAGLALYRLAWSLLFAATLVMPVLAAIRLAGLSEPAADSRATPALPFQVEAWLLYSLNLVPRCSSPPARCCFSGGAGASAWR